MLWISIVCCCPVHFLPDMCLGFLLDMSYVFVFFLISGNCWCLGKLVSVSFCYQFSWFLICVAVKCWYEFPFVFIIIIIQFIAVKCWYQNNQFDALYSERCESYCLHIECWIEAFYFLKFFGLHMDWWLFFSM